MPMWRSGAGSGSAVTPCAWPSRHHGIGAREKYSARPAASVTTLTTFGLRYSSTLSMVCAAVLITHSGCACSRSAQAATSAGSISGSSPCTLTTMSRPSRPSSVQASARRSLPVGWSARVSTASTPCAWQASRMRGESAATTTARAPASRQRCATRTTIGTPARSASGLSGSRVEASRAGISTVQSRLVMACPVRSARARERPGAARSRPDRRCGPRSRA